MFVLVIGRLRLIRWIVETEDDGDDADNEHTVELAPGRSFFRAAAPTKEDLRRFHDCREERTRFLVSISIWSRIVRRHGGVSRPSHKSTEPIHHCKTRSYILCLIGNLRVGEEASAASEFADEYLAGVVEWSMKVGVLSLHSAR